MPGDDQHTVDSVLAILSNEARRVGEYSGEALDTFDRHINQVAEHIREAIQYSTWIPENIKAAAPLPPSRSTSSSVSRGYFVELRSWMDRNRAWAAAIVAFAGTTLFLVWRSRRIYRQKRRARKALSGAKTEVIVLSGSPYSPLTKSLAIDLERRGFLVYIPVGSLEEESAVAEMRLADIHSLNFDITSDASRSDMLKKLSRFLNNPQRHGTTSLHFASLILLPPYPSTHPVGYVHQLNTQSWSDNFNAHLLYPISIANTFVPLLNQHATSGHSPSSIVFLTPSTISSLLPPKHAPESVVNNALASYLGTLRSELPPAVSVAHIRLGALDLSNCDGTRSSSPDAPITGPARKQFRLSQWHHPIRLKGVRELHNAVFDAAVGRTHGTAFVGRGARTYVLAGAWMPRSLVAWMMGSKTIRENRSPRRRLSDGVEISDLERSTEREKVADMSSYLSLRM